MIRVDPALYARLRLRAQADRRTLTGTADVLLRAALRRAPRTEKLLLAENTGVRALSPADNGLNPPPTPSTHPHPVAYDPSGQPLAAPLATVPPTIDAATR